MSQIYNQGHKPLLQQRLNNPLSHESTKEQGKEL